MRFSPIAVAVAAALLSLSAVAQEKKPESQSSQSPAMSQEQKPSTEAQGSASAGGKAKGAASGETKAGHNPELIKQVQTKLNEQGHDVGAPDGKLGAKTQKGLKEFQTSKGIKATGQLDQETMSALGVSGSAAAGASPAPSAEPKAEGSAGAGATGGAATEKPGEKKY